MAIAVKKPSYHCPVCGGPNYFKSADGWRPFCSEACAKEGIVPGKNAPPTKKDGN